MPLYTITHEHKYGKDYYEFYSRFEISELPDMEFFIEKFAIDYEPDRNEYLDIDYMDSTITVFDDNWNPTESTLIVKEQLP